MKNKILIYLVFVMFLTVFIIMPTLSFFNKTLKSEANIFKTGEWIPAQTSVVLRHQQILNDQQKNYYNSENISSYVEQEKEYFQINIEDDKNQFLFFSYRITTKESAKLFDFPVLEVFIGDTKISQISATTFDNEWHSASIDLSLLNLHVGTHDLLFKTKNTYDDLYFPQMEIKEVTTKTLFTKIGDSLSFSPSKEISTLSVAYKVWDNNQEIIIQEDLTPQTINNTQHFEFTIPENFYGKEFSYWSTDLFNNIEQANFVTLDNSTNLAISNFEFSHYLESDNELNIQTNYQNLSTISKFYLAKISPNQILNKNDWEQATTINQKEHHQFINNNLQISSGLNRVTNNLVFTNIPVTQSYLTLKLCNVHFVCENVVDNLFLE